jgi:hypothetical protein
MAIQGLRTTANFVTDQRPKNWREGILLRYPNGKIPLVGLTSLMKKRSTDDAEYNWWEKELGTRRLKLASSATALTTSNTTLTLDSTDGNGKQVKEGDLLRVMDTGEILRVASDPTVDTSIIVVRAWGDTAATALNTTSAGKNPWLIVIGSAYEEGSMAPTGVNYDPTKKYNFTQIFRNTLEMTRTASKTRLRTGDAVKEAKRECLEYHGIDMERAFWLGDRKETTINGKPARSTGGFLWLLNNYASGVNIKDAKSDHSSGVEMQHLEEYMYEIFKYGSSEKMAFCGNRSLLTINQIVRKNSHFNIQSGIKEYGMDVSRLTTPFGTLVLKNHPLFNQDVGGTTAGTAYYGMESWLAVMDMENVKYVYLDGSDTQYQPVLQSNGMDGMQSGYLSECGLEISHAVTHYLVKNLVAGKVDA